MFKLYCDNKEYDMPQAQVNYTQPYYAPYSAIYTSLSVQTELKIYLMDKDGQLFNKYVDKLTQEILNDAVLFDPETKISYKMDALLLTQANLQDMMLCLRGIVKGELEYLEGYIPFKKKLGFFDA